MLRISRGPRMTTALLVGAAPLVGLAAAGVWVAFFLLSRYASVASLVAAASIPVLAWAFGEPWPVIAFGTVAAVAVALLHKANVRRLLAGTENRFELRRRRAATAARSARPRGPCAAPFGRPPPAPF